MYANNRLLYIFKDDGIEIGQFKSIKDKVYHHINEYAIDYFKFMFLDMLSREAGKTLVDYKHKLDKIKLKRNNLELLLKLKYNFSREIVILTDIKEMISGINLREDLKIYMCTVIRWLS